MAAAELPHRAGSRNTCQAPLCTPETQQRQELGCQIITQKCILVSEENCHTCPCTRQEEHKASPAETLKLPQSQISECFCLDPPRVPTHTITGTKSKTLELNHKILGVPSCLLGSIFSDRVLGYFFGRGGYFFNYYYLGIFYHAASLIAGGNLISHHKKK